MEEIKIKLKPWGREIWFAHTDNYAGKILEVNKGCRLSLQYHEHKTETQYVYSGKVKFTFGKDERNLQEIILNPGDKFDITPYTIHRVEAIEDSEIFEVSTPELTDVVKLHDDYGRSGKGNDETLDEELSKKT
ncbi:MAG: cupin [Candidatus Peregrinibacteria bacterium]|nr:cupin [Candidatus Peregrinibacteria bacterium]MDZ4244874.1 cupin [Candidatus Gracilibacteria bacterium]